MTPDATLHSDALTSPSDLDEAKERAYYDYIDPKNTRYRDLWDGKYEQYYPSASEADLAFAGMLLINTEGNIEVAKELFLESQLHKKENMKPSGR